MKINEFAQKVTWHEKGNVQVSIAQVMELLKVMNKVTKGILYAVIKAL